MPDLKSLTKTIAQAEGFRSKPYLCTAKVWTFGHGLTYIEEEESYEILSQRIKKRHKRLAKSLDWYTDLPDEVQCVIIEQTYQLGVSGMLKFKKMIAAMKESNWKQAAEEMIDSKWYRQTPGRVERLSAIVREQK